MPAKGAQEFLFHSGTTDCSPSSLTVTAIFMLKTDKCDVRYNAVRIRLKTLKVFAKANVGLSDRYPEPSSQLLRLRVFPLSFLCAFARKRIVFLTDIARKFYFYRLQLSMTLSDQKQFSSLETERLILRGLRDEDLPEFLNYLNDPEVAKYQTWESYSEAKAIDVINEQKQILPGMPGRPFTFGTELKSTGAFIGHVVLTIQEKDHKQAEIGFTFARAHHRQGYGKEAATRVLRFAFEELSLHRVFAITDCENLASVALLSRLGMRREGHYIENIWFKGKWGDEYQYAMLQSEWASRAGIG